MADLFDVVVARKLSDGGGGGGSSITVEPLSVTENDTYTAPTGKAYSPVTVNVSGGGSSDFSTATVTIVSQDTGLVGKLVYGLMTPYYAYYALASAWGGDPTEIPIILYQGQIMLVKEDATLTISSVSGNINYDSSEDVYIITGDCTITIS